jgi:dipeptidyl aminopeptidase/acylaminoacyl peptidase
VFVGQSPAVEEAVVGVEVATGNLEYLSARPTRRVDVRYLSLPEPIELDSDDGERVHALFYRPVNDDHRAPSGERPPLIVVSHGGPTANASAAFNPALQFWTSRGFAVADVDYRGSSGYGRAYRERLKGHWGVVDVADCISTARHLAATGRADPLRTIIKGSSAGGYTALAALTFHPGSFQAGASYFGVSDLEALARDTHKFESRYLDSLVGPWPAMRDLYVERSPVHAVDRLSSAIILFHGRDDRVVPVAQAEAMADAARANGLPVALIVFDGEPHGFRRADTIRRCLEAELYFYGVVFGFTAADDLVPIQIDKAVS